jgi:PAS domain S-box-containing protein
MPLREDRPICGKREDAALYAALVDSSYDAIVRLTPDRLVESWNTGAEVLYGYSRDEMLGRTLTQLLPEGHTDEEAALILEISNGRRWPPFETVRRHKDGSLVHVSLCISPIRSNSGELLGFSHIARDISALIHSEHDAHLAAVVDSSEDAIISKTIDGIILSWNVGAEHLYGYSPDEVIGRPMSILLPKNLQHEESAILTSVREGERVQHLDTVRLHKDGAPLEVSLTISPIYGPSREVIGVSHVARNISETKHLKERLQVAQKMEALGRLAGGVAHDFNNLLTVISGYGALLQSELKDDAERGDMVNEIMRAAEKAAELTRQLLVFSRNQVARLSVLDLNEEILKAQGMLRRLIGEDISVEARLSKGLEKIRADSGQIGQILMNLAANARDAMPSGGKITIQTENWMVEEDHFHHQLGFSPGRYVRLLFTDTGRGMEPETRARIFEPFFTTKEVGKGTGLGLATVYGIVKQSNGQISVYSEPECGSTFAIYFPSTNDEQKAEPTREPEVKKGHETILLVEDEPSVRKLAYSVLQANGYNVLTAGSGPEALSQAREHADVIKLLLTDIVMPGTNGHELASQIAQERPGLRVIFMSGYSEHAILERVLSEPGAAFLQKPFTPAQLLRAIREVLDQGPQH